MVMSSSMLAQTRGSRRGGREGMALYSLSKLSKICKGKNIVPMLIYSPTKETQCQIGSCLHVSVGAAGWLHLKMWNILYETIDVRPLKHLESKFLKQVPLWRAEPSRTGPLKASCLQGTPTRIRTRGRWWHPSQVEQEEAAAVTLPSDLETGGAEPPATTHK